MIGHRGAAGHRPEHTLASYRLSILLGADYIEPDLVATRDGVLVARHENDVTATTDVADHPELASLRTTKVVDGREVDGWFTEDLTLAQLQTLRAKERLPAVRPRNARRDGCYRIPTFDEVLELARRESERTGREIGVYPETKHPSYFAGLGLPLEEPLLAALRRHGLDHPGARVFLQSFETANLVALRRATGLPLVQLVAAAGAPVDLVAAGEATTYADLLTPAGLRRVASYADAIGPSKDLVLPRDPATGATAAPSSLVADAHAAGLAVHVYTLRDENKFMATNFRLGSDPHARGDAVAEGAGVPRGGGGRDLHRPRRHGGRGAPAVAGGRLGRGLTGFARPPARLVTLCSRHWCAPAAAHQRVGQRVTAARRRWSGLRRPGGRGP